MEINNLAIIKQSWNQTLLFFNLITFFFSSLFPSHLEGSRSDSHSREACLLSCGNLWTCPRTSIINFSHFFVCTYIYIPILSRFFVFPPWTTCHSHHSIVPVSLSAWRCQTLQPHRPCLLELPSVPSSCQRLGKLPERTWREAEGGNLAREFCWGFLFFLLKGVGCVVSRLCAFRPNTSNFGSLHF